MNRDAETIFVTGGTGGTGRHLIRALVERGYLVRAVTSKEPPPAEHGVEWSKMDWHEDIEFDARVQGCSGILHLGTEQANIPKMYRANVEATAALAKSAERAGTKFFCYTSTISVYGSPKRRQVREDSPVVTTEYDARNEYLAEDFFRAYARTKLLGEKRIREVANTCAYVIFRPTVIAHIDDILSVRDWSPARKFLLAYRHSHQIFIADVVDAIIWAMESSLRKQHSPGVELYNLSNDDVEQNTYAYFLRKAYLATGDERFRCGLYAPGLFDLLRVSLKYRSRQLRMPLGMVRFSPDRLYAAGYRYPTGILKAQDLAIRQILH